MRPLRPFCALLLLAGCATTQELCFAEATQPYRETLMAISEAEMAATRGYRVEERREDILDVSECGPTLEDRAICTRQTVMIRPSFRAVDSAAEARKATRLRKELPKLRAGAEAAYGACMANARGRRPGPEGSARHQS